MLLLALVQRAILAAARSRYMRRRRPSSLALIDPPATVPDVVGLPKRQGLPLLLWKIHPEKGRVHPEPVPTQQLFLTLRTRPVLTTARSPHVGRRPPIPVPSTDRPELARPPLPNELSLPIRLGLTLLLWQIHPEPICAHPKPMTRPKLRLTLRTCPIPTRARPAHALTTGVTKISVRVPPLPGWPRARRFAPPMQLLPTPRLVGRLAHTRLRTARPTPTRVTRGPTTTQSRALRSWTTAARTPLTTRLPTTPPTITVGPARAVHSHNPHTVLWAIVITGPLATPMAGLTTPSAPHPCVPRVPTPTRRAQRLLPAPSLLGVPAGPTRGLAPPVATDHHPSLGCLLPPPGGAHLITLVEMPESYLVLLCTTARVPSAPARTPVRY